MPTKKYNEFLTDMEIGQVALVIKWLKKYSIPFKKENMKRFTDKNGSTTSFRVLVDKTDMLEDFKNEKITPEFVNSGKVYITIKLKA
jgi:hypothetical protein